MKSSKLDELLEFDANLQNILNGEELIQEFQVVPLDYEVVDKTTPTFYLTPTRLIYRFDSIFEEYMLSELEINILGERPKFTVWEQFFESNLDKGYFYGDTVAYMDSYKRLKQSEFITRFSINETGQILKEFVLREKQQVKRPYQTWAMYQIIINTKNGIAVDDRLIEMLAGRFSRFNTRTILTFIAVFVAYNLLKFITTSFLPDIVNTLLDILFAILVIGMGIWLYLSLNKNLERYETVYRSYFGVSGEEQIPVKSPQSTPAPTNSSVG